MQTIGQWIYHYDGSFGGFLTAVFTAIADRQTVVSMAVNPTQGSLLPCRAIITDRSKAARVYRSLSTKVSRAFQQTVTHAFLCDLPDKEVLLLQLIQQGYRHGGVILDRLTDPTVSAIVKAVDGLYKEVHRFKMFVRFADYDGLLAAQIRPVGDLLPLLVDHFIERFPHEAMLIYDKTHRKVWCYQEGRSEIVAVESFTFAEKDPTQRQMEELWQTFYDAVAIEGRINEKLRQNHMPKRYWADLTERITNTP